MMVCAITGCGRATVAHGWCMTHYRRHRRTGTTDDPVRPTQCGVDGCAHTGSIRRGYCPPHYAKLRKYGDPSHRVFHPERDTLCAIDGCGRAMRVRGLCQMHHQRQLKGQAMGAATLARRAYPPMRQCNATGCERIVYAKDACRMHYKWNRMEN